MIKWIIIFYIIKDILYLETNVKILKVSKYLPKIKSFQLFLKCEAFLTDNTLCENDNQILKSDKFVRKLTKCIN